VCNHPPRLGCENIEFLIWRPFMRILVTGGAGFIGSHIVDELLARGHQPFVLDDLSSGSRDNLPEHVPLFVNDIRDRDAVRRIFDEVQPQALCHQAAQMSVSRSVREPGFDAEVNILGLINVLEASVPTGVRRVVFASSGGALYGDVDRPVGEDYPLAPIAPYGISKWVGERYLQFFASEHGLSAVALRYTNVYGPRQNPHGEAGVVAIFCRAMLGGQAVTVNGDGKYVRDYVHVSDVAQANAAALEADLAESFLPLNIGTGFGADVNVLEARLNAECSRLRQAADLSPVPPPAYGPPRPGDLRSSMVSSQRAAEVLQWSHAIPLEQGLAETARWFAESADNQSAT
jgi:UDP-glucose 4-epimerase